MKHSVHMQQKIWSAYPFDWLWLGIKTTGKYNITLKVEEHTSIAIWWTPNHLSSYVDWFCSCQMNLCFLLTRCQQLVGKHTHTNIYIYRIDRFKNSLSSILFQELISLSKMGKLDIKKSPLNNWSVKDLVYYNSSIAWVFFFP